MVSPCSEVDAFSFHGRLHGGGQFPVEAAQQLVANQLGDLDAEAVENAGEFAGDEASAHNHDAAGKTGQLEQVIAHPGQIGSGDRGPPGPTTDGHQDPIRPKHPWLGVLLLPAAGCDSDAMVIEKAAPAAHQLDAGLGEETDVKIVESIHLLAHPAEQYA